MPFNTSEITFYEKLGKKNSGWICFPHPKLYLRRQGNNVNIKLTTHHGVSLECRIQNKHSGVISIRQLYGISNFAHDGVSGRNDFRNIRIKEQNNWQEVSVAHPNGTTCYYKLQSKNIPHTTVHYILEKEVLPNGKILQYIYDNYLRLIRIESKDPKGRYTYTSVNVERNGKISRYHTNSKQSAEYQYDYEIKKISFKTDKIKGQKTVRSPDILISAKSPFYQTEKSQYNKRFLLENFHNHKHTLQFGYKEIGDYYLVNTLSIPEDVCTIDYEPVEAGKKEGHTTVNHQDGTRTRYSYNKDLLLAAISQLDKSGLKQETLYQWNDNRLIAKTIRDGKKNILSKTTYQYDPFGNPIQECLEGDLCGTGSIDNYTIKREFSQDGRNLLLKEEEEDGPITTFTYLPQTDLVTTHFVKEGTRILKRTFYEYDDCHNLLKIINDDGRTKDKINISGITQRNIVQYTLRQKQPFLHMPEWKEEKFCDGQNEKLLKSTQFEYDQWGNVCKEKVYDANYNLIYTISRTYNERGDLVEEINSLNQRASYTYDEKGNCTHSTNFSQRQQRHAQYDVKNRLVKEKLVGDQISHITQKSYDEKDRIVASTDFLGNSTTYQYDPICNKVRKTEFPTLSNAQPVITTSTYDAFGREIVKTDPNGNKTRYTYNAYSQPTTIIYPDNTKESFTYTKKGLLQTHTDQNGRTHHYTYDIFGRVLFKGTDTTQENFTYNSFNLIQHTDNAGNLTTYEYDNAGRKIREEYCGRKIEYQYDSLGHIATIIHANTLITKKKYDLLDRLIELTQNDQKGTILSKIGYEYDEDGNTSAIINEVNGEPSIVRFSYDPFGRLIQRVDPLGHVTTISYHEKQKNSIGQRVLITETTDPQGTTTREISDAFGRTVAQEMQNDITLSKVENVYDPCGNLLSREDHIYNDGSFLNTQEVKYTYTNTNRISQYTRAYGTQEARTTKFTYTPKGKITSKKLPDQTQFIYTYTPEGYLSTVSNTSINQKFEYDKLGYIIKAIDQGVTVERTVDPFGNILSERWSNGNSIEKTYDAFNRILTISLCNKPFATYTYDSLYLRTASYNPHTHTYDNYDLSGNLIQETLFDDLGTLSHTYDNAARELEINSPYFNEEYRYDFCGRLKQKAHSNYEYDSLSQLTNEDSLEYAYDSIGNRIRKNDEDTSYNSLNEIQNATYDLNGNATRNGKLRYDPLSRLIEADGITFTYDAFNRKIATNNEQYIYDDMHEIATVQKGEITKARLLAWPKSRNLPQTVAIELDQKTYAVINDAHGNIRTLIDPLTKQKSATYTYTSFGEPLEENTLNNPWGYAGKRFEPQLNLVYFGQRFYDPELARWMSLDPIGITDTINLYNYLYNNPYAYVDPDGRLAMFLPLIVGTFGSMGLTIGLPSLTTLATYAAGAAVAYGATALVHRFDRHAVDNSCLDYRSMENIDGFYYPRLTKDKDEEEKKNKNPSEVKGKRHNSNQEALSDLVKGSGKKGVSSKDADTLLEWAKEYDYPHRDDRGKRPIHWIGGEHIHIGPKHVKVNE